MRTYKGRLAKSCGITVEQPHLVFQRGWVEGDLVGRNIKILAALYGMSQKEIAGYANRCQSEISKLARGYYEKVPIDLVLEVADVFNVNPRILLEVDLAKKVMEALNEKTNTRTNTGI